MAWTCVNCIRGQQGFWNFFVNRNTASLDWRETEAGWNKGRLSDFWYSPGRKQTDRCIQLQTHVLFQEKGRTTLKAIQRPVDRGHKLREVWSSPLVPEGTCWVSKGRTNNSLVPKGRAPVCSGLREQGHDPKEPRGPGIELKGIIPKPHVLTEFVRVGLDLLGSHDPFIPSNLFLLEQECLPYACPTTIVF